MTLTDDGSEPSEVDRNSQRSLGPAAARNLTSTTKTPPQMQSISPRWLLRMLPWVETSGGTYRVNRRLTYAVNDGRVTFSNTGGQIRVLPPELRELPPLRELADDASLTALAERFTQREYGVGESIVISGQPADEVLLLAHGKVNTRTAGKYADEKSFDVLADGQFLGDGVLLGDRSNWPITARALTSCTVLALSRQSIEELLERSDELRSHLERVRVSPVPERNKHGESAIRLASGHDGEPDLPGTFADYELAPREYALSVGQTVLRMHTRVADLFNDPMDQVERQIHLTVEALRERQEAELIGNPDFGLLANADLRQRVQTVDGPPTPGDLDELLSRRRKSEFFLAHPRVIAAFGRECSRLGVYPGSAEVHGSRVTTWRGVPILPCDKIPITAARTSSVLVLRTGEDSQGVVGLHQTGLPDEYAPSLNVRFMGIDGKAITSYLVSAYFSAAVLTPDALGVLENVQISR